MNVYTLENKQTDASFLKGEMIACRVTLAPEHKITEGEDIVIRLSEGKKYKGVVKRCTWIPVGQYRVGEIHVQRK
jgi:hypothetical protein